MYRNAALAAVASSCLLLACSSDESQPTNCASDAQCSLGHYCDIGTLSDGSAIGICRSGVRPDVGVDVVDGTPDAGGAAPDTTGYDVATADVAGLLPDADDVAPGDVAPDVPATMHTCVAAGTGNTIGDQIADVVLQRCDGTSLALHDLCDGDGGAVWMIQGALWDGAGITYAPTALAEIDNVRSRGVVPILFVGEDETGNGATLGTCAEAADVFGWSLDDIYVSAGDLGFHDLWAVISPGSGGSVGLPFEVVLDRRSMNYVWNTARGGGAAEVVETLLR